MSTDQAKAVKALVTQVERLSPIVERLDAKIMELEKYLEDHNQHITQIVLGVLQEVRGKDSD